MPSEYVIDESIGLVFSKGLGVFTHHDFIMHMTMLGQDARFKPEFNQIVDCRSISEMELNAEQIKDLVGRTIFSPLSRRAFLGSSDLQYGMSRMFAAYQEINGKQNIIVSRDMGEALAWLNLPGDYDPYKNGAFNPPTSVS